MTAAAMTAGSLLATTGCEVKSFIDPAELGRYEHQPLLLPILRKLDTGIEEPSDEWANATDPVPADLVFTSQDYVISAGDAINISISDLTGPGTDSNRVYRVTDSGMVNLPLVSEVRAANLTESQLQNAIKKAYKDARLLEDANVTVVVVEARGRTFSILGAVGNPGEYQILKKDFRLLDALVLARDAASGPGTDYLYIYRKEPAQAQELPPSGEGGGTAPGGAAPAAPSPAGPVAPPTTSPGPDILTPRSQGRSPQKNMHAWRIDLLQPRMLQATPASDAPAPAGSVKVEPISGASATPPTPATPPADSTPAANQPAPTPTTPTPSANTPPAPEGRYILLDGKPVLINSATQPASDLVPTITPEAPLAAPMTPSPQANPSTPSTASSEPFAFRDLTPPSGERTIRVPLPQLRNGDFRYNVVVRPGDLIIVPTPRSGVYYMGGHIARTGVYSLTGPKVTLKQAVVAAGMLDQVAIPQRTDVIRRIGTDREVFARVNLDAIFSGKQPDIFLKPDDTVMVGTNFFAPFIAAIRNGFRFSYGFGFFADRNLGDDIFGTTNNNNNR